MNNDTTNTTEGDVEVGVEVSAENVGVVSNEVASTELSSEVASTEITPEVIDILPAVEAEVAPVADSTEEPAA